MFAGNLRDYGLGVLPSNGYLAVEANNSPGGPKDSAFLTNVEFVKFADGTAQIQYGAALNLISMTYNDGSNFTQYVNHAASAV